MANTINDVLTKKRTLGFWVDDALDVTSGAALRIMGFTVSGVAATTVIFHDSTATDTAVFTIRTTAETRTVSGNFAPQGVLFSALSVEESVGAAQICVDYILE